MFKQDDLRVNPIQGKFLWWDAICSSSIVCLKNQTQVSLLFCYYEVIKRLSSMWKFFIYILFKVYFLDLIKSKWYNYTQ